MPARRTVLVTGARVLAGAVGTAAAVALVGAAVIVEPPVHVAAPRSVLVEPEPTDQQRVCPGPLLAIAQDASQATALGSLGDPTVRTAPDGVDAVESELDPVDDTAGGGGPSVYEVPVVGGEDGSSLLAATQAQDVTTDSLAGLATAACGEAVADSWLVGGSTEVGRTTLLLLANPTDVDATVDISLFGESGPIVAAGAEGIRVASGTQRVIPLAGLAPDVTSPVVRVTTRGGQVLASLQQSTVRGLVPGGVDLVGRAAAPSGSGWITGVVVSGDEPSGDQANDTGFDDGQPGLRLLVPGDEAASVTIEIAGEGGSVPGTTVEITAEPGIVSEVPLTDLAAGTYTIAIDADRPLVAAARTTVGGGSDFAWMPTTVPLDATVAVAAPDAPSPVLHLFAAEGPARVTVTGGGDPVDLDLEAGASSSIALESGSAYEIDAEDPVVAAVTTGAEGRLSALALTPADPLAAPVEVRPGG